MKEKKDGFIKKALKIIGVVMGSLILLGVSIIFMLAVASVLFGISDESVLTDNVVKTTVTSTPTPKPTPTPIPTPTPLKDVVKTHFSPWSGKHYVTEDLIKGSMNDPDSYEHVKTTRTHLVGDHYVVTCVFRGSNLYGATVTQKMLIRYTIDDLGEICSYEVLTNK